MAAFRFEFESVLKHRQMLEDQAQRALAKRLREQAIVEARMRSVQEAIRADKHTMASALVGQVDVQWVRQHGHHTAGTSVQIQQMAIRLVEILRQVQWARDELLKATQSRRIMEKWREKKKRLWLTEQNRREQRALDELAVQQYARRLKSEVA